MDRRRIALGLAGIVGLVAAIVLLRETNQSPPNDRRAPQPTIAIAPTVVDRHSEAGVLLPEPGDPPDPAGEVQAKAGDRMLRLRWAQAVAGDPPRGAAGFEVRWGPSGAMDNSTLVAAPELELRGLTNGERYDVEVRSVDAFGRRSDPVRTSGTPEPEPPDPLRATLTGLYDDFRTDRAPDPARWAVHRTGRNCLRAGPGSGPEDDRLVLDLRCGSTEAVLRARAPMRLTDGPLLGQIVVMADGPVPGGELTISVVPGPVTVLGTMAVGNRPPPAPGKVVDDPTLPPGTIRTVITAERASITAAPGLPRTTPSVPTNGLATVLGSPGVTVRWDLRLTTEGVQLRRDDDVVASADVLPSWSEATVLIGFAAPAGDSARLHVDAIGFSGEPSAPPNVVDNPGVVAGDVTFPTSVVGPTRRSLGASPSAVSARLQVMAGPTPSCPVDDLSADFDGLSVPLVPSVPGGAPPNGPYCPVVAEFTPELLDRLRAGTLLTPIIRTASGTGVSVAGNTLEVGYPLGLSVDRKPATDPPDAPLGGGQHRLAHLSVELRNAAGEPLVAGAPVPRGRVVLDVTLDGLAGQRETGALAGVAGIEVRLDNQLVAGLPTTSDGPAAAGSYQFGLSASRLSTGSHVIEVRVLSSQSGTRPRGQWLSFQVAAG